MHIAGGDGTDEIRLAFLTKCEHDTHGPSVARTAPDREEPLFLLGVGDIRGDIQAFLAEKCFDLFQSEPMLLACLPVAVVPIKPENPDMLHALFSVGICPYKRQGRRAKPHVAVCSGKTLNLS